MLHPSANTVQLRRASAGRVGLKPFDRLRINSAEDRIEAQRTAFAAGIRLSGPRLGLNMGQNTGPYSTGGAYLNRIDASALSGPRHLGRRQPCRARQQHVGRHPLIQR